MSLPQILDYLDYRDYLKDYLEQSREEKSWLSLRYLGGRIDLDAGNLVKTLQKERHLPRRCIPALAGEIGLTARESEYLTLLVEFNKASRPDKAREYYEQILDLKFIRPAIVGKPQYEFYKDWKPTAILALLHMGPWRGGETEIASMVDPRITPQEALAALNLLKGLGLARLEKGNRWVANESLLTTGEGWKDIAIREFQRQTIRLAERSLERQDPQDRDISTLTVTLGPNDMEKVRELARDFRRNVLQLASTTPEPERVYQVNLQIFPLSRKKSTSGAHHEEA